MKALGNRVNPIGHRAVVAPLLAAPGVDFADFADDPGLNKLHRAAILGAAVDLDAHLRDALFFRGQSGHRPDLADVVRERLLAIDVEVPLQRREADRRVHVVGRGNVHAVEIGLLFQQLAKIGVDPRVREFRFEAGEVFLIHIAPGDHLQRGMLGKVAEVRGGHPRTAKCGVADFAIGRKRARAAGDPRGDHHAEGEFLEERAAGAEARVHRATVHSAGEGCQCGFAAVAAGRWWLRGGGDW